jgi:hypothetical protein
MEVNLEAEAEPTADSVDGHHPQDAYCFALTDRICKVHVVLSDQQHASQQSCETEQTSNEPCCFCLIEASVHQLCQNLCCVAALFKRTVLPSVPAEEKSSTTKLQEISAVLVQSSYTTAEAACANGRDWHSYRSIFCNNTS